MWRSDALDRVSQEDRQRIGAAGVRTIVDLRTEHERRLAPHPFEHDSRYEVLHVDLFAPVMAALASGDLPDDPYDLATLYQASLRLSRAHYQRAFELIDSGLQRGGAVIVHCTIGKDRTGMIAALLQHAAGVTREAIVADYVASHDAIDPLRPTLLAQGVARGLPSASYARLLDARAEAMERTLAALDDELVDMARPAAAHLAPT